MPESRSTNGRRTSPERETLPIHTRGLIAEQIGSFNWASSPLGPIKTWSDVLVSYVNLILSSPQPAILAWGDGLTMFYNDAASRPLATSIPRLQDGATETFS